MKIVPIFYNRNNVPFVKRYSGEKVHYDYGDMQKCKGCNKEFFSHKTSKGFFCSRLCSNSYHPEKHTDKSRWKGGRRKDGDGYIRIMVPNHPNARGYGYVYEHRIIIETRIKRLLKENEVVHHINGITSDNRIENLIPMTKSEHIKLHHLKKEVVK